MSRTSIIVEIPLITADLLVKDFAVVSL